jgi:hypothetical protein
MTIAFTVPFWLLIVMIPTIGFGIALLLPSQGDYDMFTPLLAVGIIAVSVCLSIGLALGKYVF